MGFSDIVNLISNTKLYHAIFLVLLMMVILKIYDLVVHPFQKNNNKIQFIFLNGVVKAFIIIAFLLRIGSLSGTVSQFMNSILMSSSLIVVVLGFIFQEGLANIIHGFLLILSKPFNIGDRIQITIDGQVISGYVKDITIRNTIVRTVSNDTMVIIPNAKMDMGIIDNSYFDTTSINSHLLDITITYESDLEKAIAIYGEVIAAHPLVREARPIAERDHPVNVLVSDLGESAITLRARVVTNTIEQNFQACSDIRRSMLHRLAEEPDVDFAYPHIVVVPK